MCSLVLNESLVAELKADYQANMAEIRQRLSEFKLVPQTEWFYELCFCLLTPQTSALHAHSAIMQLKCIDFQSIGGDPTPILRRPEAYIRFHNVKSQRLLNLRATWADVEAMLVAAKTADCAEQDLRNKLCNMVRGLGMKEASHFLRNAGWTGLAIIDRHVLRSMEAFDLVKPNTHVRNSKHYVELEEVFIRFAQILRIPTDELDLLLWKRNTGHIFK